MKQWHFKIILAFQNHYEMLSNTSQMTILSFSKTEKQCVVCTTQFNCCTAKFCKILDFLSPEL